MMVHNVYFWLRKDLTPAEVKAFEKGVATLTKLPSVRHGWIGKPSSTNRPIIDRSYSYGLTVVFDDLAGHDAYQVDPDHLVFVNEHKDKWSTVKIYDFDT
jgi:hypothetical protein